MEEEEEQGAQLFRMSWGKWLSACAWGVKETEDPGAVETTVSASSESTSSDSASPKELRWFRIRLERSWSWRCGYGHTAHGRRFTR